MPYIVTAPDSHSVTLQPDLIGRVLDALQTGTAAHGDAGIVTLDLGTGYDLNSNLSSVKPTPSAPAHGLLYNSVNLLDTYTPPPATGSTGIVGYHYNADRQLDKITRPDNSTITFGFESSLNSGRVVSVTFPNWAGSDTVLSNLTYDPVTRYLQSASDPGGETVDVWARQELLTRMGFCREPRHTTRTALPSHRVISFFARTCHSAFTRAPTYRLRQPTGSSAPRPSREPPGAHLLANHPLLCRRRWNLRRQPTRRRPSFRGCGLPVDYHPSAPR